MKKLVLASLALVASTLMAFASVDAFDLHAPPADADLASIHVTLDQPAEAARVDVITPALEAQMDIAQPENTTRIIGETQGYLGLPIADVTIDCAVNGPDTPAMITHWLPSAEELAALNAGAPITVQILGTQHPPILLGVGDPVA